MKTSFIQKKSFILVILGGILAFFLIANSSDIKEFLFPSNAIRIEQHVTYVSLPYDELVNTADIIFVGKVIEISPSRWNQNSGDYWGDNAIQYHTIRLDVTRFVANKADMSGQTVIEITILGTSVLEGNQDYSLQIGDEVLVFAGKTDFAWREGGTRPAIMLKTSPSLSFFVRTPNGNFEGQAFYSTGQGEYTPVETVSLPLSDLTAQIQNILNNSTAP